MRKEEIINLDDRGIALTFKIKEMSATKLESWLIRAVLAITGKADLSQFSDVEKESLFNIENILKLISNLDYEKAKPLLDELLLCCFRVVDNMEVQCKPESIDDYVTDVKTIFKLRFAAAKLNLSFMGAAAESIIPNGVNIKRPQK